MKIIDMNKYNCIFKNTIRLCYKDDNIYIYLCCIHEYVNDLLPLKIIPVNEFLEKDIYSYLLSLVKDNKIRIIPQCLTDNDKKFLNKPCPTDSVDTIEVCTDNACNLSCKMCGLDHKKDEKSKTVYFTILDRLKNNNITQLALTQHGEPFFYKKETLDYLTTLTNTDFKKICIVSNLTLLDNNDITLLNNIVKEKKIKIFFVGSIDAITEQTYKKIRRNNLFNKVMQNANLLVGYNLLKTINFVIQEENIDELLLAYEYWHNIKNIEFNPILVNNYTNTYNYLLNNNNYKQFLKLTKK